MLLEQVEKADSKLMGSPNVSPLAAFTAAPFLPYLFIYLDLISPVPGHPRKECVYASDNVRNGRDDGSIRIRSVVGYWNNFGRTDR